MKTNKNLVPASIVIVALIVVFGWIQIEKIKTERVNAEYARELSDQLSRDTKIGDCLAGADTMYDINWNSQCLGIGRDTDCLLGTVQAEAVEEARREQKKVCIDMYK